MGVQRQTVPCHSRRSLVIGPYGAVPNQTLTPSCWSVKISRKWIHPALQNRCKTELSTHGNRCLLVSWLGEKWRNHAISRRR